MLTKLQAGSVPCDQKLSRKSNLSFFKAVSPNRLPFYLGSMLSMISSLFRSFRSWDYPENFGIYFLLDRESETGFFTFLSVYVSWIKRDKILNLSPPNSGISRTRMDQKGTTWKWILTVFKCKNEVPKQIGLENQMKIMGSLVLFSYLLPELWSVNCQKLCPFCGFLLMSVKNLRLL